MVNTVSQLLALIHRLRACLVFVLMFVAMAAGNPVHAQSCGENYRVKSGDSLSRIAQSVYGDRDKWTLIYNVNLAVVGSNPNLIQVGQNIRIPCLVEKAALSPVTASDGSGSDSQSDNSATSAAASKPRTPEEVTRGRSSDTIRFLTADDYAPFTDRGLINDGLVTDMLVSAMRLNPDKPAFEINWVNDWSQHLEPLLSSNEYDMGFPWLQPDCESTPDDYRCQNFRFSYPVFQMLVLLFVDKDRPLVFETDEDIEGAVLCRPNGYYTHDLEKNGRLWLTNNVIELKQPDSIKDCFEMLSAGTVDAVALNEFTGRSAVNSLSMKDSVEVLEGRPLSIEGLHVVIHKKHPRASELIELVNESMSELQLSDTHREIVDTHFREYWSTID